MREMQSDVNTIDAMQVTDMAGGRVNARSWRELGVYLYYQGHSKRRGASDNQLGIGESRYEVNFRQWLSVPRDG